MILKRKSVLFAGAVFGALMAVSALPKETQASTAKAWGMSNLGEICVGTCKASNICCGGGVPQ